MSALIRCDGCSKEADEQFVMGWTRLEPIGQTSRDMNTEPKHFCGSACILVWARRQLRRKGGSVDETSWLVWRTDAAGAVIYWRRDSEADARRTHTLASASLAKARLTGMVEMAPMAEPDPAWVEAPMEPTGE